MAWWRREHPEPEPAVTEDDRAELVELRRHVDDQLDRVSEIAGEAKRRGAWLRRERTQENHLAERLRRALEGLS